MILTQLPLLLILIDPLQMSRDLNPVVQSTPMGCMSESFDVRIMGGELRPRPLPVPMILPANDSDTTSPLAYSD